MTFRQTKLLLFTAATPSESTVPVGERDAARATGFVGGSVGYSTRAREAVETMDVDVDHPEEDQQWDSDRRSETATERLDRNWGSLLQELRVVQTGVQLLTGFLLTLPFQQRFDVLDGDVRVLYLATVSCAVASTVLLVAPVGMHRVLFRQRRLKALVSVAHRLAYAGLLLLGLALAGMTVIIFAAVADRTAGLVAGVVALAVIVMCWVALPFVMRSRPD